MAAGAVALQFLRSQLLAPPDIQFARSEHRNAFYYGGSLRNPKIRNAGFIQASTQLIHFDRLRGQEYKRFAFCFIRYSTDGDAALASFQAKHVDYFLFYHFVWHHFAANLGETRKPPFDIKKAVFIQTPDISGL